MILGSPKDERFWPEAVDLKPFPIQQFFGRHVDAAPMLRCAALTAKKVLVILLLSDVGSCIMSVLALVSGTPEVCLHHRISLETGRVCSMPAQSFVSCGLRLELDRGNRCTCFWQCRTSKVKVISSREPSQIWIQSYRSFWNCLLLRRKGGGVCFGSEVNPEHAQSSGFDGYCKLDLVRF